MAVAEEAMKTPLAIDRSTGRSIHPFLGNTSFADVRVLDDGDDGWSFKSLATTAPSNGHAHATFLEVYEFAEGVEKPFLAIAEGFAFTGVCR